MLKVLRVIEICDPARMAMALGRTGAKAIRSYTCYNNCFQSTAEYTAARTPKRISGNIMMKKVIDTESVDFDTQSALSLLFFFKGP